VVALAAAGSLSVLLVDDDQSRSGGFARQLVRAGFIVHEANADDALRQARQTTPDLVVLDLVSPRSGTQAWKRLRKQPDVADIPILALIGQDDVAMNVGLPDLGYDDYVITPCASAELSARIRGLLRRHRNAPLFRRLGALHVQLATGDAWVGERGLELTAGERAILATLARAYPSVASRAALDHLPWRPAVDVSSNVTEVLMARLRQKLRGAGAGVEIRTVRRAGYRMQLSGATETCP
jgi:two-component system OmpR family response regulator